MSRVTRPGRTRAGSTPFGDERRGFEIIAATDSYQVLRRIKIVDRYYLNYQMLYGMPGGGTRPRVACSNA